MLENVTFQNDGLINLRAVTVFGMSAKEIENPIGYFGTGLKYAIAIILRECGTVSMYRGLTKYEFTTKETTIRSKKFQMVYMNGQELPFTTDQGKNWATWQAFRELHCNCTDENGTADLNQEPIKGKTTFVVTGANFLEHHDRLGEIILQSEPAWKLPHVNIHRGSSPACFYRGISVHSFDHPTYFTYNLTKEVMLTEDRTLRHPWQSTENLTRQISQSTDKDLIKEFIYIPRAYKEHLLSFHFRDYEIPSQEFIDILHEVKDDRSQRLNPSIRAYLKAFLTVKEENQEHTLTAFEEKMYWKAVKFCEKAGYPIGKYTVNFVNWFANNHQYGYADQGIITLSQGCFDKGMKFLVIVMIEEYIHLDTGHEDESRDFQTYLLQKLVSLYEEHVCDEIL